MLVKRWVKPTPHVLGALLTALASLCFSQVLAHLVQSHMDTSDIIQDSGAPLNFTALATQTEGYSVTDLKDLVARAVHRAAIRSFQPQPGSPEDHQQVRYLVSMPPFSAFLASPRPALTPTSLTLRLLSDSVRTPPLTRAVPFPLRRPSPPRTSPPPRSTSCRTRCAT